MLAMERSRSCRWHRPEANPPQRSGKLPGVKHRMPFSAILFSLLFSLTQCCLSYLTISSPVLPSRYRSSGVENHKNDHGPIRSGTFGSTANTYGQIFEPHNYPTLSDTGTVHSAKHLCIGGLSGLGYLRRQVTHMNRPTEYHTPPPPINSRQSTLPTVNLKVHSHL